MGFYQHEILMSFRCDFNKKTMFERSLISRREQLIDSSLAAFDVRQTQVPQEMEFQIKIIFAAFMVITFCCQKMVASPLGSRELSESSNDNLNELEEIINSELAPLTRSRRYVVIQVMGKLAHDNGDDITRRHPRHHRFNHRRHHSRLQLKKI